MPVNRFAEGFAYPFRAIGEIRRTKDLWGLLLPPVLINIVVGGALIAGLAVAGFAALDELERAIGDVDEWISTTLRVVMIILVVFVSIWLMVRIGLVLGAPWYEKIAERVEERIVGPMPPGALKDRGFVGSILGSLGYEVQKAATVGLIAVAIGAVGFIPVVGQIVSTIGNYLLTAALSCLDYFNGPLARRDYTFSQKFGVLTKTFPASAGFGAACAIMYMIPLFTLVSVPICMVAGTMFVCERVLKPELAQQQTQDQAHPVQPVGVTPVQPVQPVQLTPVADGQSSST